MDGAVKNLNMDAGCAVNGIRQHPSVGVGAPDDPSEGFDLDGQILPHTDLPPFGGRDIENAIHKERKVVSQEIRTLPFLRIFMDWVCVFQLRHTSLSKKEKHHFRGAFWSG